MLGKESPEDDQNLERGDIEELEFRSLSFIMAKPDATRYTLDILIEDIITNQRFDLPGMEEADIEKLSQVRLVGTFSLRLTPESSVLDDVYEYEVRNRNFEFLDLLKRYNAGDVTFYILVSSLPQDELEAVLNRLKGNKALVDDDGNVIKQPVGIRGKFLPPGRILDFSDPETRRLPELHVNLLHTSDNIRASRRILQMYLENSSCIPTDEMRSRLENFLYEDDEDSAV
jgi:hypothetical protein